ncbi:MAG TPA: aldehyde dehydrogenase family protein [Usitatibacter sp.]|nr:aldehyde dehydrogenase family protein [Usitatibacter sp.]
MSAKLDYASNVVDAGLSSGFEPALERARQSHATVAHRIDGQWTERGAVESRADPCDPDRTIARYHIADAGLVDEAVKAAKKAAKAWRSEPFERRCDLLREAKPRLAARQAEIAGLVSAETGKIRIESLAEISEAIDLIEYYATQVEEHDGFARPLAPGGNESRLDVLRPYGVFGVIVPFNFPVALAVNMTAAALLTGNTVVVKPSAKTPRSTTEAMLVLGASLPPGVLNIVQGDVQTGESLAKSDVDGIAFTGSAQVGWGLVQALHADPRRKPVLAEMGGQNPAIVCASADLDVAAAGIVRSAFGLSGQKCSSCRRAVVQRTVAKDLVDRLRRGAESLKVGDPADAASQLGPVIDGAIAARIEQALATAGSDGKVLTGGRMAGRRGHYFRPIIVGDLAAGHALTRTELFAPFLTVVVVDSFEQAMLEANAVEYGLSAGIYTNDEREQQAFLDGIEAGVLYVNRAAGATTGAWPGAQPFCGWKSSGSTGKGGLGPWYLPGFMREQSRTIVGPVGG